MCEQCGKTFTRNDTLHKHRAYVHKMRERKFKCNQCGHSSDSKYNLKAHIDVVHDKIRNHVCEECGQSFSQKNNLKLHIQAVHEMKEKSLKCEQCPYSAYLNSDIKKHVNYVHKKIRNHVCDQCGYAASRVNILRKHMAAVHKIGGKKLKCELCPHKTYWKHHLKEHVKTMHQNI